MSDESKNAGYGSTGNWSTGYWSTGYGSTGNRSTGYGSTGYGSTGNRSTGYGSTGYRSTGDRSTGDRSTGYRSTGYRSTGDRSTGDRSTGDRSTGYRSTGDRSTGYWSTGDRSTGNWSTGNWSISDYSTGHFSTKNYSGFGAFNKPCTTEEWDNAPKPSFLYEVEPTRWVPESEMTDEEKKENSHFQVTEGYLKTIPMEQAWKEAWDRASEEDRELLYKLPNFDADVFKEITGIDVTVKEETIEISGKKFSLSTIKEALKNHVDGL